MLQVGLETYRLYVCFTLSNLASPKPKNFICSEKYCFIYLCPSGVRHQTKTDILESKNLLLHNLN